MQAAHSTPPSSVSAIPVDPAAPATPEPAPTAVPTPSARAARQAEVVQALLLHLPAHALLWHSEDTIIPGPADGRPRHLYVKVQAPGGPVLTTQLFFPDDPANPIDPDFRSELLLTFSDPQTATFDFVIDVQ